MADAAVDITESPRALEAQPLHAHRDRQMLLAVVEQARLLRLADQMPCQRPRLQPAAFIKLAKLGHRLLDDATIQSHAAHKTPVAMDLAVLPSRRVAQVHALITTQRRSKENGDGRHYTPLRVHFAAQPLEPIQPER